MEIAFVRTEGGPDRVYAKRTSGSEISWAFPAYGGYVPHDLVHLVVETAFGLKNGFWGRVDRGVDPGRVNAMANRIGGAGKYAGFGPDQIELYVAETLAGTRWRDPDLSEEEIVSGLVRMCPALAPLTADRVGSVRGTLDRLSARWKTLLPKGTLHAKFDPEDPEKSYPALGEATD